MSIQNDITYKFASGSSTISQTRQIVADADGSLDLSVPNGSKNLAASFSLLLAKVQSIFLLCDQAVTLRAGGVNAVQTLSITGSPTGGTFTVTYSAVTSGATAWNATAAQVVAALNAMASIGANGVTATGGPLPATPVVITFGGVNSGGPVTTLTNTDSLTGGTSPAVAIASTVTGVVADTTIAILAGVPLVWDRAAYFLQPFSADVATLRITNASGVAANLKIRTLSNA